MTAYRNEGFSQLLMFVAAVATVGSVLVASSSDVEGPGRFAPPAVMVALGAFCYFRLARAAVYAGEEGIRIVNPLRTVRLPWSRVVRFNVRRQGGFPAVGFVMLDDGTEIKAWALQARNASPGAIRVANRLADELNERLAQARAASPANRVSA
ncbi:MAG TPA: PH domain-containing protein [Solirubrobacteraceae bacterium]|nr:PH domain-containing protein [Solirubrobacteraceae bacterium]